MRNVCKKVMDLRPVLLAADAGCGRLCVPGSPKRKMQQAATTGFRTV